MSSIIRSQAGQDLSTSRANPDIERLPLPAIAEELSKLTALLSSIGTQPVSEEKLASLGQHLLQVRRAYAACERYVDAAADLDVSFEAQRIAYEKKAELIRTRRY